MMQYREMTIDDYTAVMALWSDTEAMLLRDADSEANIGLYLAKNQGLSFVALAGKTVIGAVLVGTDGRRGYVQHLAVATDQRGQGIGKQLIAHAVQALKQIGIPKTHLFVANDNLNAQHFYAALGWYPRDEVRMYSFNASENTNV